ncbi:MAG: XRE family transcriptional regulator [Clostridia bacterium]|nr:XRE family transcriptional regulator [Clostridia bacterium]
MSQETLSKNIRYYRKARGMTQQQLAEALYIAPQTVSKWESGISEPDIEKLCAMADLFAISLDTLARCAPNSAGRAYIAIDGGGTKTAFVLFRESGEIIDQITLGGSNPNAYGIEVTKDILACGIEKLLSGTASQTVGIFAGIAGAGVGNNRAELNAFLKTRFPYVKSCVEGDFYNVINCVDDSDRYIAVICGTGSVVYANDGNKLNRLGGWGYLFDEAGSGFDIGRDLFRHCLACEDEGRLDDGLYLALRDALGGGIFANISTVYAKGKDYIASFAPLVFDFYDKGDIVAVEIVERTAQRLSYLIDQACERYDCGDLAIIAGGLTSRRDILEPLIKKHLRHSIRLVFPKLPPIFGAAVRCMKLCGGDFDAESFEKNFVKELSKPNG